jgi:hypothetical protein
MRPVRHASSARPAESSALTPQPAAVQRDHALQGQCAGDQRGRPQLARGALGLDRGGHRRAGTLVEPAASLLDQARRRVVFQASDHPARSTS